MAMRPIYGWPDSPETLEELQLELGRLRPDPWTLPASPPAIGGVFVCFERGRPYPGKAGERGWAGAATLPQGRPAAEAVVEGRAGAPYHPGLLALREGPLLEGAVRALGVAPQVLLVNATGRDHPRRAGLALHLGAVLGIPTVGVTHRPLVAEGVWPAAAEGATSPLFLGDELAGHWVRTRTDTRPLVAHAGWRTDPETAVATVLAASREVRTPEPLRRARLLARTARAG